ncbi:magnesium transporter CorA family protein [Patescibacteria group bacterium]
MSANHIKTIEHRNFKWTDIHNGKKKRMDYLIKNFDFHPLDLDDCLSITHRSKCDQYPLYSFLILLFPTYNKKTREIKSTELDFFISKDYLVTVHRDNNLKIFSDFFEICNNDEYTKNKFLNMPSERLLYEILNKLYLYCFPMLDHISSDIDHIEKQIFSGNEKNMVHEISVIRRNITDFRKIMQPQKNVLKKLITSLKKSSLFKIQKNDIYFDNLIDCIKEIWDALENYKERIEALQETNESLITYKLNDIMKILTIISVITFPITLIAGIFGMNTPGIPFTNSRYGFWIVVTIMLTIAALMLRHFKRRGWM